MSWFPRVQFPKETLLGHLIFPHLLTSTSFPLKGKIWLDAPEPSAYRGPIHYTSINQETWYSVTMTGIVSESSVVFGTLTFTEKRGKLFTEPQFSLKLTLGPIVFFVKNGGITRITNYLE